MRKALLFLVALLFTAAPVRAQSCTGTLADKSYCNSLVEAADIVQPRVGVAFTGGNPIPGASSTLGMRIGSVPRVTVAARMTGAKVNTPWINDSDIGPLVRTLNLDAAVGVFSGLSLAPTIGGFGSLDVLASVGKSSLGDDINARKDPTSWALGARVGILRESFTAPGISVTGMYRSFGDIESSANVPSGSASSIALTDNKAMSVRAIVGKRLLVVGANVGIGYDRYKSSLAVQHMSGLVATGTNSFSDEELTNKRFTAFANASWTMLILHVVGELGYQNGGDAYTAPLPSGVSSQREDRGYYGSIALRLAL